jgi:glycosyltransferase involved in cell wall biosynthesis
MSISAALLPGRPPAGATPVKLLALCDSPLATTGFARVARNLLGRWARGPGVQIDCWAVNFEGWEYWRSPVRLFPGGLADWNSPRKLGQFLGQLQSGGYTHVWLLMDPDALNVGKFVSEFRRICRERKIRSLLYYPLDAPPELDWLPIVTAVDAAVAYTEYGRAQTRQALCKSLYPIEVIPHGVDEVFAPLPADRREAIRKVELQVRNGQGEIEGVDFVKPGDFLILNVNKNEWRKDPLRSLEILAGLRQRGIPAKLIFRMNPLSAMGGVHLELAARQMGLVFGKEWCHVAEMPDQYLCGLYNAADLYLTTSLGEGWGLGVTEAIACHCPVALPDHTSLTEIGNDLAPDPIWLPLEDGWVCGSDTRLRRRVDLAGAVEVLAGRVESKAWQSPDWRKPPRKTIAWDEVAAKMWKLLSGLEMAVGREIEPVERLASQSLDLCHAIEELPASEQQTRASIQASNLHAELDAMAYGSVAERIAALEGA